MQTIPLTKGKAAIVCDCHAHLVNNQKWYANFNQGSKNFYAARFGSLVDALLKRHTAVWMHRVINNTPEGMRTDHINGNTLDNRCVNLRTVSATENNYNRGKQSNNQSGFKGVLWHKQAKNGRRRFGSMGW